MPRILLFDIDATLIRTHHAGRAAIDTAFSRLYGLSEPTAGVRFDGRTDHAIFSELLGIHGLAGDDLEASIARAFDAYLEELPASLAARPGIVLPGVPELLDALAIRPVGLGLATGNLRRGAERKLAHFNLWHRFIAGGFGDATPVRAEVVRRALENIAAACELDPDPASALVIGDTPLDVEAAHLAGIPCLAVATGAWDAAALKDAGADHVLPDLADTTAALEILLG